MKGVNEDYYYKISISYEVPYNILDSEEPAAVQAKETLYENLKTIIPEKYEKFSAKLVLHQLKDTYNYLVTYDAFIRVSDELPMASLVEAREARDKIKAELEEFFSSADCEYKQVNIKALL